MDRNLEKQFHLMEWYLRSDNSVHEALIEFTKLMKMMYEYIKKDKVERHCNETDERTGCF